jgi:anti-sigma-K factor RskA
MTGPTEAPDAPDRDDDALAAEYALGLLDGAELEAFQARLLTDPALRAQVAGWHETLVPMADDFAPVAPRAAVKVRVMDKVWGSAPARPGLWRSLGFWRLGTLTASIAAASLAAMIWLVPPAPPGPPGPVLVVNITSEDGSLVILAAAAPDSGELRLARQSGAAPPGRVLELWAIDGDAAPVSLGVLPGDGQTRIALPDILRTALPDLLLAVSEEPPGGSPTGAPTGAVLAVGQVQSF